LRKGKIVPKPKMRGELERGRKIGTSVGRHNALFKT